MKLAVAVMIFFGDYLLQWRLDDRRSGFFSDPRPLSDAFSVAGLIYIMVGLMAFVTNQGSFEGIRYTFRRIFDGLFRRESKVSNSYYEYLQEKGERQAILVAPFFFIGFIFLGIGLFMVFYHGFY